MFTDTDSESDSPSNALKWWLISKRRVRRWSVHPLNKERVKLGEFYHLYQHLKNYPERFYEYLRMSQSTFNYILQLVEPRIQNVHTNLHKQPISAEERLVVTLRFLATGNSFKSLSFSFRLGASTIAKIVPEVTLLLWEILQPLHMKPPNEDDFKKIAKSFYDKWHFPNCLGSIDGKHVRLKCPTRSGTMFYNYKHYFSIVLQAVCDANCRFVAIEVGAYGKQSDGGTFRGSELYKLMEKQKLNIPDDEYLPKSNVSVPYVFLGDEAYPLLKNLMKPYARNNLNEETEIFNNKLSRARKTVECSFGILTMKWRILSRAIETLPDTADLIIKSVCVLHNVIIDKENIINDIGDDINMVNPLHGIPVSRRNNRFTGEAASVRNTFKEYFVTERNLL